MNKVLDLIYQQTNELRGNKKENKANFFKSALSGESAGARTRDPNIKSVVLYLLSYGFSNLPISERYMLSIPFRRCKFNRIFSFHKIKNYFYIPTPQKVRKNNRPRIDEQQKIG